MVRLKLTLLGGFEAIPVPGPGPVRLGKKVQALLAYLALRPERPHSRGNLAALLWGDMTEDQARHNMRQALFALRQALSAGAGSALALVGDTVALRPEAVDVDAVAFERLAAEATARCTEEAAALYRGDLLAGLRLREAPFEEWLRIERERLRDLAVGTLDRLLALYQAAGAADRAVQTANRLLEIDPAREDVHRVLIRLHLAAGQLHGAMRQYHTCAAALQRELGVKPEPETRRLYERLLLERAGRGERLAGEPDAGPEPVNGRAPSVLVVEDEPVTRTLLEGFLGSDGYRVTTVADGAEALLRLGSQRFDVVVADLAMPTVDGLTLLEVLGRQDIRVPVVVVTGQPDAGLEVRGLALGAADYLRKPVQKEVLLSRVRRVLARR